MKLREFTSLTNEDGSKIVCVSGRIADHQDQEQQKEYITFQFSVDLPTARSGAILRKEALEKVQNIANELKTYFWHLAENIQR